MQGSTDKLPGVRGLDGRKHHPTYNRVVELLVFIESNLQNVIDLIFSVFIF